MAVKYYSPEGLERLKKELHHMKTKGRAAMSKQLAEAREKGDLSENAEYDAAKEAQGLLEMKIAKLEEELGNARLLDPSRMDTSKVMILSKVKVKNLKFNKIFDYQIVSQSEANLKEGKISFSSPIATGLLGHKVGDKVDISVPAGSISFEILEITM
ncbi:MAG: transcription elongation factor GreA [Chitinophagales bacterium]